MKSCLIIFSTTDGHTKKICDQIFNILGDSHKIKILNLSSAFFEDLSNYNLIIVGASIRYGKHKKELYEFIRKNRRTLEKTETCFFSVNAVARKSEKNLPSTNPYMKKFLKQSGWIPDHTEVFAGEIDYKKYKFFDKHIIRFIMWLTGGPTDTSKKYDFTNWDNVQLFADRLINK